MAENLVVNGVQYNGVDSLSMTNTEGKQVQYFADAVRYEEQALTDEQKAQARENVGALSSDDVDEVLRTAKESGEFDGRNGALFLPIISDEGVLGWELIEYGYDPLVIIPDPVNIRGVGIKSTQRTSGDGSPGTTDTYTITYDDGRTDTFTVYNGKDGEAPEVDLMGDPTAYYTPVVTQPNGTGSMVVSYEASNEEMPDVEPVEVTLPSGADGKDGTSVTVTGTNRYDTYTIVLFSDGSSARIPHGEAGADGERGTGILKVTTAPTSYTTTVGGVTPVYRIALSTIRSQAGVYPAIVGDIVEQSYYHYPVIYVDTSYAYLGSRTSIRGDTGAGGTAGVGISSVTQTTTSDEDGGENQITMTLTNGKTSVFRVFNGSKGSDGYTPQKGVDYFTAADKTEMVNAVLAALPAAEGASF